MRKAVIQFVIEPSIRKIGAVDVSCFSLIPSDVDITGAEVDWAEYRNIIDFNWLIKQLSKFLEEHLKDAIEEFTGEDP